MTPPSPRQALSDIITSAARELARQEHLDEARWAEIRPLADAFSAAILRALATRGYAMVPLEPTEAMKRAGLAHAGNRDDAFLNVPPHEYYSVIVAARPR